MSERNDLQHDLPKAVLPTLALANGLRAEDVDASDIAAAWISRFNDYLQGGSLADLTELFHEESWWRDILALSWDTRAVKGPRSIAKYLKTSGHGLKRLTLSSTGMLQPRLMDQGAHWVSAGFDFETRFGVGRGVVMLVNTDIDEWKAWVFHTILEKLHEGQAEQPSSKLSNGHMTNSETIKDSSFDHTVVVVGGGSSGLMIAAQLRARNIDYIVLEKFSEPGGMWHSRYHTVATHTPSYMDVYPSLKYPKDYPDWPARKDIIKWMHTYVRELKLNIRHNVTVTSVTRSSRSAKSKWHIQLTDNKSNETSTLTCRHVVLTTGIFSASMPKLLNLPSHSQSKGKVYHSVKHTTAPAMVPSTLSISDARVVIIGTGSTGYDIAADYVSHGAKSVTVVQRTPTFNASRETARKLHFAPYNPALGGNADQADVLMNAMAIPVLRSVGVGMAQVAAAMDKELLDGLEAKGVQVKRGDDGDGFPDWLLIRLGGFYLDQGVNELILDGKIKFRAAGKRGVLDVDERGVVFEGKDGGVEVAEADVVVLATGFARMDKIVDKLMPVKEDLKKLGRVGFIDREGERIGVSTYTSANIPCEYFPSKLTMLTASLNSVHALQAYQGGGICSGHRRWRDGTRP
jgi:thioredoxin reductase